jgi:hypothetical protein
MTRLELLKEDLKRYEGNVDKYKNLLGTKHYDRRIQNIKREIAQLEGK